MAKKRASFNLCYVVVVLAGIVFAITATAYGLMALRAIRPELAGGGESNHLMQTLDRHGVTILGGELLVLALATVGAIAWDGRLEKQAEAAERRQPTRAGEQR